MFKPFQGDMEQFAAWLNDPATGKLVTMAVAPNGHVVAVADDGKALTPAGQDARPK